MLLSVPRPRWGGILDSVCIIDGTGAIPRLFTAWIRAVILWFPTVFAGQQRIGYDADVAECLKTGGSSVRPRWNQGVPFGESNNKHCALVNDGSNSESGESNDRSKLLWHKQYRDFASSEERSTGGLALPGDCPVTGHTLIPTVSWLGSLQTQS